MTVEIWEAVESRPTTKAVDASGVADIIWKVSGATDPDTAEDDVEAAVESVMLAKYRGLFYQWYKYDAKGNGKYDVTVHYGAKNLKGSLFQFDTSGGTQKRLLSYFTKSYAASGTPTPTNAINVGQDKVPKGVDVEVPKFCFTITKIFDTPLPTALVQALYSLERTPVNSLPITVNIQGTVLTFQAGELLYQGGTGGLRETDWEVVMKFSAEANIAGGSAVSITGVSNSASPTITTGAPHGLSVGMIVGIMEVLGATEVNGNWYVASVPNSTTFTIDLDAAPTTYGSGGKAAPGLCFGAQTSGLTFGGVTYSGIQGVAKKGWEYIDVWYEQSTNLNQSVLTPIPKQVNVHKVYLSGDLSALLGQSPPTNLTATAVAGAINLSWTGAASADSYNVYRSEQGGSAGSELEEPLETGVMGTTFEDDFLEIGDGEYFYYVKAVSSEGESDPSNEASAEV